MPRFIAVALIVVAVLGAPTVAASPAPATPETKSTTAHFDGASAATFTESVAAFEADMSDAEKLGFHMKLAQVRNKLAEQRGRHLTDAEFAAALDGKSLAEFDAMADAAPAHITIEIETSDDT